MDRARASSATTPTSSPSDLHAPAVALVASTPTSTSTAPASNITACAARDGDLNATSHTTCSTQCPSHGVTMSVSALTPIATSVSSKFTISIVPERCCDLEPAAVTLPPNTAAISLKHDAISTTGSAIASVRASTSTHVPTMVPVDSTSAVPLALAALSIPDGRITNEDKVVLPLNLMEMTLFETKEQSMLRLLPQFTPAMVSWDTSMHQLQAKFSDSSGSCDHHQKPGYASNQLYLPWPIQLSCSGENVIGKCFCEDICMKLLLYQLDCVCSFCQQNMDHLVACAPTYHANCATQVPFEDFLLGTFGVVLKNFHPAQVSEYLSLATGSIPYLCALVPTGMIFPYGSVSLPWKISWSSLFDILWAIQSTRELGSCILWSLAAVLLFFSMETHTWKGPMEQWDPDVTSLLSSTVSNVQVVAWNIDHYNFFLCLHSMCYFHLEPWPAILLPCFFGYLTPRGSELMPWKVACSEYYIGVADSSGSYDHHQKLGYAKAQKDDIILWGVHKLRPPWPPPLEPVVMDCFGKLLSSPSPITDNDTSSPCVNGFLNDVSWRLPNYWSVTPYVQPANGILSAFPWLWIPIKYVCVQNETVLRRSLGERIRSILTVNKMDGCFLELQVEGEESYQTLACVTENANVIMVTYEYVLLGDVQVYLEKGTIVLSAVLHGWAGTACKRCYVLFCYESIKQITDIGMNDQLDIGMNDQNDDLSVVLVVLLCDDLKLSWDPGGCNRGSFNYGALVCLQVVDSSCLRRQYTNCKMLFLQAVTRHGSERSPWEIAWSLYSAWCADGYVIFLREITWPMVLEHSNNANKSMQLIPATTVRFFAEAKATSGIKVESPTFRCVCYLDRAYPFDKYMTVFTEYSKVVPIALNFRGCLLPSTGYDTAEDHRKAYSSIPWDPGGAGGAVWWRLEGSRILREREC